MKRILPIIFVLFFVVFCGLAFFLSGFKTTYLDLVKVECEKYDLDENLILAMIKSESKFDKNAVSKAGAIGLMQILPSTASWIAEKLEKDDFIQNQLFNEKTNIEFGCYYISYLLDLFGNNEKLSICAYNAGPNVVNNWLKDESYSKDGQNLDYIPYKETSNYYNKVSVFKNIYAFFVIK